MSENSNRKPLPQGWAWTTLADVLSQELINGRSVKTLAGGFPVLRLTALKANGVDTAEQKDGAWTEDEAFPYLVEEGDFLVSRGNGTRSLVGRGALVRSVPSPVAFPDTMIRIRTNPSIILPQYLKYLWDSKHTRDQIEGAARTTAGIYKINQKILERVSIPLPPLAEQRRIVEALEDHLSRLDAAEVSVKQCSTRLRRLRDTVSNPTFGYTVGADADAATAPSPAGTIDGDLPRVPSEWRWSRLEDVAEVVGGVTKDSKKQSDPDLPEVPYLRVANVQRGRLDLDQVSLIRVPPKKAEALALQSGDVLMNEGGDRDKLGRGWVWEGQVPGAIHQNHVFRARVFAGEIDPKLLSWYANSSGLWFERNGKQSVNLASISLSKIKKFPLPVPPEGEQQRIVERIEDDLSVMDSVLGLVERSGQRSASLRRALLVRAFSGRLAHQDSNDEPAHALLARAAAERAANTAKTSRRRAPQRSRTATAQQEFDV
nr:hypothetical protein KitaXyl93_54550 [Kitasatospora sp. Xyl93]